MDEAPKNFRLERIEKLLHELRYEIERGLMEHEIEEEIGFRFIHPLSRKIPNGVVIGEFRLRPMPRYAMGIDDLLTKTTDCQMRIGAPKLPTRADGGIDWSEISFDEMLLYFWWNTKDRKSIVRTEFKDFGPLVAAHARERCAQLVKEMRDDDLCAAAIRKMED